MIDMPLPIRKKLIEHSLPLDAINAASSREKSVRHGHPSTLHLWWARRPLAACRAVLFGQLVDDPSAWPDRFKGEAAQDRERRRLHKVIEDMVEWPKSAAADQKRFEKAIEAARVEIARSVAWGLGETPPAANDPAVVLAYLQTKAPPVYDPFCGGGSIPLEAQRLGLRAYGSDLNPVAVLITKALIEFPPKFAGLRPVHPDAQKDTSLIGREWKGAQGLAEDVRRYGQWMRDEAEKRIGHLYPKAKLPDGGDATVIAWLWARTVASPDPAQKGAYVPLASSFILSSKEGREAIVKLLKDASAPDGWRFEVKAAGVTKEELSEANGGTKGAGRGSSFVCALSGTSIDGDYIKAEGKAGRMGARLMAVVAEGNRSRIFVTPTVDQEEAALIARPIVSELEQPTPERLTGGTCFAYGLDRYDKLFTSRQLTALRLFSDLVSEARTRALADALTSDELASRPNLESSLDEGGSGPVAYADAVATYLAFARDKCAEGSNAICTWSPLPSKLHVVSTFGRQALPMVWDYAEANPFASSSGNLKRMAELVAKVLETALQRDVAEAVVFQKDAASNSFGGEPFFCTDPPYYDNIAYSDLSDFFYVWLRLSLSTLFPDSFRRVIAPKREELVATPYRHGSKEAADDHFMSGMKRVLSSMRAATNGKPLCLYYAFKQSEASSDGILSPGWSSFLQATVDSGLQVDGTWPVRTERAGGFRNKDANALAASIVLVCRKRPDDAPTIGRRDFLRELKPVMAEAILAHQKAGIPLPDRRQAAIGPGIGVFSKYSMVREPDDSSMRVATALALINKEIDELLAEGSEELDAETRFALEWYAQQGYKEKKGGAGDAIAQLQAFNLAEARINASGLFRARGGDAKLLTREEMHAAVLERYRQPWRPSLDDTFTVWELAQHMARTLRAADGGVEAAGRLLAERRECGPDVLLVAERMFELATRRGENDEALIWNELQTSWPEIESAADRVGSPGGGATAQSELDL